MGADLGEAEPDGELPDEDDGPRPEEASSAEGVADDEELEHRGQDRHVREARGERREAPEIAPELLSHLPPNAFVADLTYRDTDLLVAARERGLRTLDGLGMLVHQGARAFELWTGQAPPVAIMLESARKARAARS